MSESLSVFIVEDEALLQLQLTLLLEDLGHVVVGASASASAANHFIASQTCDVALVDVHLADGPTGLDVGRRLSEKGVPFMFVTANAARLPKDYCGALGVISKPYSEAVMQRCMQFLETAINRPPPSLPAPAGMELAPDTALRWAGHQGIS